MIASEYAKLTKGTLTYLGNVDLREYYVLKYDFLDSGKENQWQTQVYF